MEWQPIETAPTGDQDFIGWDGEFIRISWEGWHEEGKPVYVHGEWRQWEPTHWMPLPKPPVKSDDE